MKELPVPYWSRVVSHRVIDVLNRALEKYRLGQSEPIFVGGKFTRKRSPKDEKNADRVPNCTSPCVFLTAMGAYEVEIEASFCEALRIAKEQKDGFFGNEKRLNKALSN